MARFDVYRNPGGDGFLVSCQTEWLDSIRTRVVIPLLSPNLLTIAAHRLNPSFQIAEETYVLVPQFIASVPTNILGPVVTSLAEHQHEIVDAIDMLITGY